MIAGIGVVRGMLGCLVTDFLSFPNSVFFFRALAIEFKV